MLGSRLYGVELDSITGRIAQKLYPQAEIKVAGFETTDRRDFYDLAVGNVPFGNYRVSDNKKISQRTLISKSGVKFLCRTEPMSRNRIPENRSKFKTVRELILHCALPPVSVHCTERGEGVT